MVLLEPCKLIEQHKIYHPEGNVWIHSFQCLKHALRETNDISLIVATWCHDIGKSINKLGHEKEVCSTYFTAKSLWLIRNHMRIHYYLSGEMHKLSKIKEIVEHPWLPQLIQLIRFDNLGRKPNYKFEIKPKDLLDILNEKAKFHFMKENNHEKKY